MSIVVYLADLRHNYMHVLASDAMPLNVGYMKAVMDRDLGPDSEVRVFAYPDRLLSAMQRRAPDVLMLSNYTWNEQISLYFARLAKAMKPDTLVVMGGPNIYDEPDRQKMFLAERPELDWPQLFEPGQAGWHPLATSLGVTAIPRLFLIDKKGVLRSVDAHGKLDELLVRLLAE